MTEETIQPPAHPALTGDSHADTLARHAHFDALTKHFDAHPPAAAAHPNETAVAAITADLREAGARFKGNTAVQSILERELSKALSGGNIDRNAVRNEIAKIVGAPAEAPAVAKPAAESVDQFVRGDVLHEKELHGYQIPADLQHMEFDAAEVSRQFRAAKVAGISQQQIDIALREMANG